MYNPFNPPPAPPGFATNKLLPEDEAGLLSRLVFGWLNPFLDVGYSRFLEQEDLWTLPPRLLSSTLANDVETHFYARCPPHERPAAFRHGAAASTEPATADKEPRADDEKYNPSLIRAFHDTFKVRWWIAGALKLCSDTLKTTTPLLTKVILTWLTQSYAFHHAAPGAQEPSGIGYGIGLAFALFVMQEAASLMSNHFMMMATAIGLSIRSSVITAIFHKSLRLSGRARLEHSVGQITTIISSDATRLDRVATFAHNLWVSPIQLIIGVALLINNLGYSALVGVGVLVLGFPLQFFLVTAMFTQRKKGVGLADARVRLGTEVLQGIRLLKIFGWEDFYLQQIEKLRDREITTVRKFAFARSSLIALVTFIPVLASILTFITYSLSGHNLNIATIFSSLQLFNIIRAPLFFLPLVLSATADALVALGRIGSFLRAEEIADSYTIEHNLGRSHKHDENSEKYEDDATDDRAHHRDREGLALVVDADFTWETARKVEAKFDLGKPKTKSGKHASKAAAVKKSEVLPVVSPTVQRTSEEGTLGESAEDSETDKPFELKNLRMSIPRGSFVAIVGRVASGKSSVLQGLIGEMRKTRGTVTFGGNVAYVPQTAWIRNASLRENILFGLDNDEDKFRDIIRACSLQHDLEMLPYGEHTEIGEKGINLSGGQKARVSIARAAYSESDIVLLDDSLSAVDAYVGKALLENCIMNGPLADRTRILVTHALHFLDKVDYIYVMDEGVIAEEGTYEDLLKNSTIFAGVMEEYGSMDKEAANPDAKQETQVAAVEHKEKDAVAPKLMTQEERNTGSVTWSTYGQYLSYAGGLIWAPIILALLTLSQSSQVGNNLFLGFWTSTSIRGFSSGDYMAVYASFGLAQAIFSLILSFVFAYAASIASLRLFKAALSGVMKSPSSFFDTTPVGRILSRISKDQDTLDNELSTTFYQFLTTFSSVIGTIALVFYTFPLLGIIFAPMTLIYYIISVFYRHSSVETKRLDSLLRSALYASYSETLGGLPTIRAYRVQDRASKDAEKAVDMENRAYYMTIAIQRWLGVRLDLLSNTLVLGIALFAAGFRNTIDPSKIGVVLTYTLSTTQVFGDMVQQYATSEQNMNAVERVLHYAQLPAEGAAVSPDDPPESWPQNGEVAFKDVCLAYREGLPLVLKGVSFRVSPGEKVGVIGRTGAGKSSLIQALFRLVELHSGTIEIDGVDTRKTGLKTLRQRLALVPQDSTLFLGSLRENLDPQGTRTDAELISSLQKAWLLPRDGTPDPVAESKFSLDSKIGDEGSNYSAGEKQLIALTRALVKNSRIIILDEATSSVDVSTDAKLQRTIQTEFANSTLICVAHRLNTIAYYDRIIVMDAGRVAEFDTVLNLFDKEDSIFRSLCNEANLSRLDILKIRESHLGVEQ